MSLDEVGSVGTLLEVLVVFGLINLWRIVWYWYTGDCREVKVLPVVWGVWSFVLLVDVWR